MLLQTEGVTQIKKVKPVNLTKGLRLRQADADDKMWACLSSKRLSGLKFRKQFVLGKYKVDFINFEQKLIIEIDSGQHDEQVSDEKERQRTSWLEGKGYTVLRFWNSDVIENIDGVLSAIQNAVRGEDPPSH